MGVMHDEGQFSPEYNVAHVNYPYNLQGFTDHVVNARTADCFCEPNVRHHPGPYNGVPGPFILIDHQPISRARDPFYDLFDPITRLFHTLRPTPPEGWDSVMDREKVDRLLSEGKSPIVQRIEISLAPLVQGAHESFEDFVARITKRRELLASFLGEPEGSSLPEVAEKVLTQQEFEEMLAKRGVFEDDDVEILDFDLSDFDDEDEFEFTIEDDPDSDEESEEDDAA